MVSKVQQAKDAQGYIKNPRQCSNCVNYRSEFVTDEAWSGKKLRETGKRCSVGGFAVQYTASCLIYERKR